MSNLNFHQMFEIQRQNDFKSIKKLAWVVFISFLLCVCFQFLPIILDFAYDLKLLKFNSNTNILAMVFNAIFLISYLIMILKLYFVSQSKVLLISFFIAAFTQFIALLSLNYLIASPVVDKILRIFLYGFSFLCLAIAIFCIFIFFKTLKTLCENKIYFKLCFIFKSAILIIIYILMFVLIYSEHSLALIIAYFMIFSLQAYYLPFITHYLLSRLVKTKISNYPKLKAYIQ